MKNFMLGKKIYDIISVGWMSKESGVWEYLPYLNTIYFDIWDGYIRFDSVEQYSKLRIEFVKEISYNYPTDEDMLYA